MTPLAVLMFTYARGCRGGDSRLDICKFSTTYECTYLSGHPHVLCQSKERTTTLCSLLYSRCCRENRKRSPPAACPALVKQRQPRCQRQAAAALILSRGVPSSVCKQRLSMASLPAKRQPGSRILLSHCTPQSAEGASLSSWLCQARDAVSKCHVSSLNAEFLESPVGLHIVLHQALIAAHLQILHIATSFGGSL